MGEVGGASSRKRADSFRKRVELSGNGECLGESSASAMFISAMVGRGTLLARMEGASGECLGSEYMRTRLGLEKLL